MTKEQLGKPGEIHVILRTVNGSSVPVEAWVDRTVARERCEAFNTRGDDAYYHEDKIEVKDIHNFARQEHPK